MTDSLGLLLVVDDEEMNRDMLARRLEVEGYQTVTAADGAEALRMIDAKPFDAVLLDVMMPGLSGLDVLAEIRKSRTALELPVLMVTAKSQSEDIVAAFEGGANDYITKPIQFPVALARIKNHVAGRRLSSRLRESEMRYSLSAQGSNDGLWDWDLTNNRIHYSDRWKSILGLSPESVGSGPEEWFDRIHPDDRALVEQAVAAHRSGASEQFECEYRMRHDDGTYRWVLSRGIAIRDAAGRETRMAGSQTDITRGKGADPLTGLPNRVQFMDHLESAAQGTAAQPGSTFAVLFVDLDRFKLVNDSLGHLAGDEMLVAVARRLESCIRSSDIVAHVSERSTIARFGGDEFVILLQGLREPNDALAAADRILAGLEPPLALRGQEVPLSASIGIAVTAGTDCKAEDLLRDADTAMYRAKVDGKSCRRLFDPSMRKQAVERLALEADVRRGIERDEFTLHYQPIVEMPSGDLKGIEALLRWNHATRGCISPAEFVPLAEEIGFIVELGAWVLDRACRQLRQWRDEHPDQERLFVSVNVSSRQFADPGLVDCVAACLERSGLDPELLKLEITESAIMANPHDATETVCRLRDLGVRISLDDFGTGYSSLSYLQNFKIDTLKIDRSFIARLGMSDESDEIVRTIVGMAHNLGMEVTAEGIEENMQHDQLQAICCDLGQGYLYSRPVPAASIDDMLAARDRAAEASAAGV